MSESSTNPFVLPGMGQSGDLAGNPLLAGMEMMRQAWVSLAGPGGLAQSVPMAPPMSMEELERRIAELRSVEGWLRMNLSMLGSAIQGMEVQRATIATLRAFVDSATSVKRPGAADDAPSPLEVVLGLKPAPAEAEQAAAQPASPDAPPADEAAAPPAAQAWWDMLQQQFNHIASATAASMAGMAQQAASAAAPAEPSTAASGRGRSAAEAGAKPAGKTAAGKKTASSKRAPAKRARKTAARKTATGKRSADPA